MLTPKASSEAFAPSVGSDRPSTDANGAGANFSGPMNCKAPSVATPHTRAVATPTAPRRGFPKRLFLFRAGARFGAREVAIEITTSEGGSPSQGEPETA